MRTPHAAAAILAMLLSAGTAPAQDAEANAKRLKAMPPERRQALMANLRRLDGELDPAERAAVRALDAKLAELDPGTRDDLRKTMRRYYLWLQTLPPDQRKLVETAAPDDRRVVVQKIRDERRRARAAEGPKDWMQVSSMSAGQLQQAAFLLKSWFGLDAQGKAEVLGQADPAKREEKLGELGKNRGAWASLRVGGTEFDEFLEQHGNTIVEREVKKAGKAGLKSEARKKLLEDARKSFSPDQLRRIREAMYLRGEPATSVTPARLRQFEAEIPEFLRQRLENLPPEAAHRRLEILYRLVFPHGHEIPPPPLPAAAKPGGPTPGASL